MTPRLPWLPARRPDIPPVAVAAPGTGLSAVVDALVSLDKPIPSGTRYPWTGTPRPGQEWAPGEATVLLNLAAAGGDLTAHRTVHLEDR